MNNKLTQEEVRRLFDYVPETGVVTRKVRTSTSTKAGEIVGAKDNHGYFTAMVNKKVYKLHRIIYLWMTGFFPDGEMDHINGVRDDNRWCNLRTVSRTDNSKNKKLYSNNASGFNGVNWYKPYNTWVAKIRINRKDKHLGYYDSLLNAVAARISANARYGFHDNHGRLE